MSLSRTYARHFLHTGEPMFEFLGDGSYRLA